uniref:Uncharacterized protein n=1 Tax=Glossina austeni TaxID=7395 RepID=A0A1A9VF95_GLOAU
MLKIIIAEGLTSNTEIEGGFWNFYSIVEIDLNLQQYVQDETKIYYSNNNDNDDNKNSNKESNHKLDRHEFPPYSVNWMSSDLENRIQKLLDNSYVLNDVLVSSVSEADKIIKTRLRQSLRSSKHFNEV